MDSSLADLLKVGLSSFIVATIGVVLPFGLGWLVSSFLLAEHSLYVHAFIGATLCATSVGITARVLRDIGKIRTREATIILGAAVIDDVLGLVVLAIISGLIIGASTGRDRHSDVDYLAGHEGRYVFGGLVGAWGLFRSASHAPSREGGE